MTKKLLLIIFFFVSFSIFSQQKGISKLVASPNPFTNNTTIFFNVNNDQPVLLSVKNVLGKTVFTEKLKVKKGRNSFPFRRNDLKAGMYIYAIQTNKEVISKRFVIK
ncbi:T9SS type A sorting domain-containing protein [Tenacibaculum halocynthiae]|uniref:T9SS type A sorting domain-containing protein n=1 Tax=Tenacibaculum halocynthiae TaxID=1254437 RepID=UPI003D6482D6